MIFNLLILLDDNDNIFVPSLLILYCSFSPLILSSIAMINFYSFSKRWRLKRKELSDARAVSFTKEEWDFSVHFSQSFIKFLKLMSKERLTAIC